MKKKKKIDQYSIEFDILSSQNLLEVCHLKDMLLWFQLLRRSTSLRGRHSTIDVSSLYTGPRSTLFSLTTSVRAKRYYV